MQPQNRRTGRPKTSPPQFKKCSGECGQTLPLSSFDIAKGRKDGRRSDCKVCARARRGPRGKEGQQARALLPVLRGLIPIYTVPSLAAVLTRAVAEVEQIGASGAGQAEQVLAVRKAVFDHGCRYVDEIVEETNLSRFVVDRALKELVASKAVEERTPYLLEDVAAEPGRPATQYHPADSPRGEDFTHRLYSAAEDDLL